MKRGALHFLVGTVLSRISGFFRDLSMAFFLGTPPALANFMVAFRFAHVLRRLIGEARLGNAFIAEFERTRAESSPQAALFVRDLFFSITLALLALILLLEGVLFPFRGESEIVQLTMLMLPGLLFIALFALGGGLLQCEGKFLLSGAAPVAFNLVWILLVTCTGGSPESVVIWLALGTTLALALQWAVTLPKTLSLLQGSVGRPRFFPKEVRALIPPLLLASIGLGAEQLGGALDSLFARVASPEGPTYLWYAIRIEQLPLALFAIAYATSLLPSFARAWHGGDAHEALQLLEFSLKRSFAYTLPAALGLFALGFAGINLLYGRGNFSPEAVCETTRSLWGYGLGLVPSGWAILLAIPFFATRDFWTPARASLMTVGANLLMNSLLIFHWECGPASVAFSTGVASWLNAALLFYHAKRRFGLRFSGRPLIPLVGVSMTAAAVTLLVGGLFLSDPTLALVLGTSALVPALFSQQLTHLASLGGAFLLILLSCGRALRVEELSLLIPGRRSGSRSG